MAGAGNCKPVAGYPSMKAATLALARKGLDQHEIAKAIGSWPSNVAAILSQLRKEGELPPLARFIPSGHMPLDRNLLAALAPHAEKRGITPPRLAERLLTVIAGEDLVDAVLDDGEGSACAS